MSQQEKILEILKKEGPSLPSKVGKQVGTSILFASAMLSELSSSGKVKISKTKIDGSPVYYLPGQESKLQDLYSNLNDKDKKAFDLLKENKILNDDDIDPLSRVSLRGIKDFAIPLNVSNNGNKYTFWKWYLVSKEEAENLIRNKFEEIKPQLIKEEVKKVEEDRLEDQKSFNGQEDNSKEEKSKENLEPNKKDHEKENLENASLENKDNLSQEDQKDKQNKSNSEYEEKYNEEKRKLEEERKEIQRQRELLEEQKKLVEEKNQLAKEIESHKNIQQTKEDSQSLLESDSNQKKITEKKQKEYNFLEDEFFLRLKKYFEEKEIEIINKELVRKNSEFDLLLNVPSVVGKLMYYCKAKDKKRVNDADLSTAYVQGQLKKLPSMIIITGDMTKKAKDLLESEFSKNLVVQKI